MAIIIRLDMQMAEKKVSLMELAEMVGVTPANLSILKNGKAKGVRFSTLEPICEYLQCQPGDLIEYKVTLKHTPIPDLLASWVS